MVDYHIHEDFQDGMKSEILKNYSAVCGTKMNEFLCSTWGFEKATHYIMVGGSVVWVGSVTMCKKIVEKIENGTPYLPTH